eukprot:TRINITY_DN7023_c0_g1_i1.p1 TRINITY_DN7023_c0_g1~~TRINITY_DN7023_c0_g1_i1.p1  ORF type:complete len:312 (-),score=53.76 TRINITY_DN7023_c0_g1_i1:100-1014(-)
MAARRSRASFSQELFEEQLQSMRKANATCDLGSLAQVTMQNADDSASEADDGNMLSRSETPESSRPPSPGSAAGIRADPLELSLLEAIQALQDPNIGQLFKMFIDYVKQMRIDVLSDVGKHMHRKEPFVEEKRALNKSSIFQDLAAPRKGRIPRWLDTGPGSRLPERTNSAGSWAASATAPPRPKVATSRPALRTGRQMQSAGGSQSAGLGGAGGSQSAGREARLPSWLRVQPKNTSRPPAFKPSDRLQTIAEPASKDEEREDPSSSPGKIEAQHQQDAKQSEATTRTTETPRRDEPPVPDDAT